MTEASQTAPPPAKPESGWGFVAAGIGASAVGALMWILGLDAAGGDVLVYIGALLTALGAIGALIGCIAVGVSLGMRHANHSQPRGTPE